jgi:DNA-binding winged helix-turn-helix (wHTH) protein/TolB-like protein
MPIRFDDFEINDDGELLRDGAAVRLQPQPMKVLSLLASRAGQLITRDEIRRHVWGDDTFVDFDQGLNWCIRRIREVLGDDAAAPRFIQTMPRRGYRFIAATPAAQPRSKHSVVRLLALAVAVFAMAILVWPRTSVTVLVLPFDNLGVARAAEDVATEEVITSLAGIDPRKLSVIDPLTAMKFKRTHECIIHIGRQLDAQYVLLGAVRQRGSRLRTTAQLFRVADNRQVWAAAHEIASDGDPTATYGAMARDVAAQLGVIR